MLTFSLCDTNFPEYLLLPMHCISIVIFVTQTAFTVLEPLATQQILSQPALISSSNDATL